MRKTLLAFSCSLALLSCVHRNEMPTRACASPESMGTVIENTVRDPDRAGKLKELAEKACRQNDELYRLTAEYVRQVRALNADYDARFGDFTERIRDFTDRRRHLQDRLLSTFFAIREHLTKKEWNEFTRQGNNLFVQLLGDLCCSLSVEGQWGVAKGTEQRVQQAVPDRAKARDILADLRDLDDALKDFSASLEMYGTALEQFVSNYNTERVDFWRVSDAVEESRDKAHEKILRSRFRMREMMTPEQWNAVFAEGYAAAPAEEGGKRYHSVRPELFPGGEGI